MRTPFQAGGSLPHFARCTLQWGFRVDLDPAGTPDAPALVGKREEHTAFW
jgi:hypothetical protein